MVINVSVIYRYTPFHNFNFLLLHHYTITPFRHFIISQYFVSPHFLLTMHVTKSIFYIYNVIPGKLSQFVEKYLSQDLEFLSKFNAKMLFPKNSSKRMQSDQQSTLFDWFYFRKVRSDKQNYKSSYIKSI